MFLGTPLGIQNLRTLTASDGHNSDNVSVRWSGGHGDWHSISHDLMLCKTSATTALWNGYHSKPPNFIPPLYCACKGVQTEIGYSSFVAGINRLQLAIDGGFEITDDTQL